MFIHRPADPGFVETNIMREFPPFLSKSAFVVLKLLGLLQSPDDGVRPIIDAALAPPVSPPFPDLTPNRFPVKFCCLSRALAL